MIDYILDYLGRYGQNAGSAQEEQLLETGIALYLEENGIDTGETRPYFRKYVGDHLKHIDPDDLKTYFIRYSAISGVRQIAMEWVYDGAVAPERAEELCVLMTLLHAAGLGEKYIPSVEVREILGHYR